MKFQTIKNYACDYAVAWMCEKLQVSRSGFYAWQKRPACPRRHHDAKLTVMIRTSHNESRQTYGSPRILSSLQDAGVRVSRKRVARLMRQEGLQGLRKRRFVKTTDSKHNLSVAENILDRKFTVGEPNKVWVGDITYLATHEGWLYLATVIDLYSRKVVGWCIDDNMRTDLVSRALNMAIDQRAPLPGLVFHSDRGSQYASADYQALLRQHGITCSMSRKAECWDNSVAESFFGRFKDEFLYRRSWPSKRELYDAAMEYIACFYNLRRKHSALGYMSPMEYEATASQGLRAA